uniref:Endoribonuclease n=1 Tax=Elaeophora elaphi TaxID=1147741 RepID=A0A0R3RVS1_9BILA
MGFTAWYLSLLYLIAISPDVFNGSNEFQENMVRDSEIVNLVNQFRQQDINKADDGQIILDYQKHTTTHDSTDNAERRLFKSVDAALLEKDTYKKWIALINEFEPEVGIEEKNTPQKKKAIDDFLDAIFKTTIWKNLFQAKFAYYAKKEKNCKTLFKFSNKYFNMKNNGTTITAILLQGHPYATDLKIFRAWIRQLWFGRYSRKFRFIDSSGFEHVFVGELKNDEVNGMHSWLRFYLLERNASQQFDYHGYTVKRANFMAAVKFSWRNHLKRSTSIFIGTSPEFDMALYTLCFLTRQSRNTCKFEVDGCPFFITSYNFKQQGKNFIGTIYPVSGPFTDKCRYHNS